MNFGDSVRMLKSIIQEMEGVPPNEQLLVINRTQLRNFRSISHYLDASVKRHTVRLVVRQPGPFNDMRSFLGLSRIVPSSDPKMIWVPSESEREAEFRHSKVVSSVGSEDPVAEITKTKLAIGEKVANPLHNRNSRSPEFQSPLTTDTPVTTLEERRRRGRAERSSKSQSFVHKCQAVGCEKTFATQHAHKYVPQLMKSS
jgi:hypothetical protein